MTKAGENTLGRLTEVLFEELAILNARVTRARVALRKRVMA